MSGIIDTVGSKSGIIGSDVYPAGHMLQVVDTSFYNTNTATGSGDYQDPAHYNAITPKAAGSKIWVTLTLGRVYCGTGEMQIKIQQRENTGSWGGVGHDEHIEVRSGTEGVANTSTVILYSPSYVLGDVLNYRVMYRKSGGSSDVFYHNDNQGFPNCLTLAEIAG